MQTFSRTYEKYEIMYLKECFCFDYIKNNIEKLASCQDPTRYLNTED